MYYTLINYATRKIKRTTRDVTENMNMATKIDCSKIPIRSYSMLLSLMFLFYSKGFVKVSSEQISHSVMDCSMLSTQDEYHSSSPYLESAFPKEFQAPLAHDLYQLHQNMYHLLTKNKQKVTECTNEKENNVKDEFILCPTCDQ